MSNDGPNHRLVSPALLHTRSHKVRLFNDEPQTSHHRRWGMRAPKWDRLVLSQDLPCLCRPLEHSSGRSR